MGLVLLVPVAFIGVLALTLIIAWAPFAALICALTARRRELNRVRYAIAGAVYSALLFLPWLYLIRRMRGKEVSVKSIREGYFFAYALAARMIICNIILITVIYVTWGTELHPLDKGLFNLAAELLMLTVGLISLEYLRGRYNKSETSDGHTGSLDLPHPSYILPFAFAAANITISARPWYPLFRLGGATVITNP